MLYLRGIYSRRVINLDHRLEPDSTGKWVISGKRGEMGYLWKQARDFVRIGDFYEVKYCRIEKGKWNVIIYADNITRQDFLEKIYGLKYKPFWVSNEETRERNKSRYAKK